MTSDPNQPPNTSKASTSKATPDAERPAEALRRTGARQALATPDTTPVTARLVTTQPDHPQPAPADPQAAASTDEDPLGALGRSKLGILVMVFVAAGIMGLPLILYSRKFNRAEKGFWTVIVLLYTIFVFYLLYLFLVWLAGRLNTLTW